MKMKAKSVLSSVIALGLAFGAVSAQADDRHGFDAEGAMAKHGIERGGVSSEDYFEAMQNEARSRASGLGISSQDATARVGASSDSSGARVEANTAGYWSALRSECEAQGNLWMEETRSCLSPHQACQSMGFEWKSGACEIQKRNLSSNIDLGGGSSGSGIKTGYMVPGHCQSLAVDYDGLHRYVC